jgi:hypothetical protein
MKAYVLQLQIFLPWTNKCRYPPFWNVRVPEAVWTLQISKALLPLLGIESSSYTVHPAADRERRWQYSTIWRSFSSSETYCTAETNLLLMYLIIRLQGMTRHLKEVDFRTMPETGHAKSGTKSWKEPSCSWRPVCPTGIRVMSPNAPLRSIRHPGSGRETWRFY